MVPRIKLGELLVRAGVLDDYKLKAALAEQGRWGGRLGKILVDMGFLSEDILVKALSKQLGLPTADFGTPDVPLDVRSKIDADFCQMMAICPQAIHADRGAIELAMADPMNVNAVDEVRARTGLRVEATIAGESRIMAAIQELYGTEVSIDDPGEWMVSTGGGVYAEESQRWNPGSVPPPPPPPGPASVHPSVLPPLPASPVSEAPPPVAVEMASALESAQKQQLKAIRAMVDLLIEKGAFSREEYLSRVSRK